jgi:hypothetical protein
MAWATIAGTISHLNQSTEVSGYTQTSSFGNRIYGRTQTSHVTTFRIEGKPALLKMGNMGSFTNGDRVSLVGKDKPAGFIAYAIRNDTTGAVYTNPTKGYYWFAGVMIFIGYPFMHWIFGTGFPGPGLPFIGFGAWLIYYGRKLAAANELLASLPKQA